MMETVAEFEEQPKLFNPHSYWYKAFLILLFLLAFLIRRDEIRAPGHLIEREYNSAIFARAFYFQGNERIENWRQENAIQTRKQFPLLEPPVTEYLVSLIYRVVGREDITYSRYLTSLFWLIGGIFFYKTVRLLISSDAALFALIYYLFAPWGIIISRSFQPDSLMMMAFLISLFYILVYFENPSWKTLITSAVLTGLTLLLRPLVLFLLLGAFVTLHIYKNRSTWLNIVNKHLIVFVLVSLAFPFVFYGWGIFIAGFLQSQANLSFRPWLLTRWQFWLGWFNNAAQVAGPSLLAAALIGFFVIKNNISKALILGMGVSYFIFGLVFTYHVFTHPYYHVQLIPIVGIGSAPLFVRLGSLLRNSIKQYWPVPGSIIFLIGLFFSHAAVIKSLYHNVFESPTIAQEIGEIVDHSPRTVFVSFYYGLPLEYYGEFSGSPWPAKIDDPFLRNPNEKERSIQERIDAIGFVPEYYVITNFSLFNRQHEDLKVYLNENCSVDSKTDQYLIYSSCKMIVEGQTNYQ